jgi:beta-phosphoglucomutase-like phosphatase (HAD superfamily)
MTAKSSFILGLDLDGVVADYYAYMREVAAEWRGVDAHELTTEVTYGLPEWGLRQGEYDRLHRFAVTQRQLFSAVEPIKGAPQAVRRLSTEGVRIRIITHRLVIRHFHQDAVQQTVQWLDHHGVPYWDPCFMKEKGDVGANIYIEDTPANIAKLREADQKIVVFTNSTNRLLPSESDGRADTWAAAEGIIRKHYYEWCRKPDAPCRQNQDSHHQTARQPSRSW